MQASDRRGSPLKHSRRAGSVSGDGRLDTSRGYGSISRRRSMGSLKGDERALNTKILTELELRSSMLEKEQQLPDEWLQEIAVLGKRHKYTSAKKNKLNRERDLQETRFFHDKYQVPGSEPRHPGVAPSDSSNTFRPEISERSRQIASSRLGTGRTLEQLTQALCVPKKPPRSELAKECTFQPHLNHKSLELAAERDVELGGKYNGALRTEQMFRVGQTWQAKRDAARREAMRTRREECTFRPKLSTRTERVSANQLPFQERVVAWQEARAAEMEELALRVYAEENQDNIDNCTFVPAINPPQPVEDIPPPRGWKSFMKRQLRARANKLEANRKLGIKEEPHHFSLPRTPSFRPRDTVEPPRLERPVEYSPLMSREERRKYVAFAEG